MYDNILRERCWVLFHYAGGRQRLTCCEENSAYMQQVRVFCIRASFGYNIDSETRSARKKESREETEKTQWGKPMGRDGEME